MNDAMASKDPSKLDKLKEAIAKGIASAQSGELKNADKSFFESIKAEGRKRLQARLNSSASH